MPDELVAMLGSGPEPDPVEAAREAQGWLGDLRQLADDTTDTTRWEQIEVPTLLMQSADTWSPIPEGMEALHRAFPRAERVTWKGQSHFATMTAPDLFAATVADSVDRLRSTNS